VETHRCKVKLVGRACEHDLCVTLARGVPRELRCESDEPRGYGAAQAPPCGCVVPSELASKIERVLRFQLEESRRAGFVLLMAA
jgi:hypothetical protein